MIRAATRSDLPAIVAMLADDPFGAARESLADLTPYQAAFARIRDDQHQHLVSADRRGEVVGTLQPTVIPCLSRKGATPALIEAVRIHASDRGHGLGTQLIQWRIDESWSLGAALVQLTSDVTRKDAHRFFERLGFEGSHVGFKLSL